MVLHMIAGALAATRPASAVIIQSAAEAHVVESARTSRLSSADLSAVLGDERARELRARGADMDWDQAIAYTLTQATEALSELGSGPPAIPAAGAEASIPASTGRTPGSASSR